MRRIAILALAIVGIWGSAACATPPSALDVKFTGTKVDVTAQHAVMNPREHYIRHILITVNGVKVADRTFTSQTDAKAQVVSFDIPSLKKGDKVTVEADCNMFGDLTRTFVAQ